MTAKVADKQINGDATAEDVAQSVPQQFAIADPLVRRIIERAQAVDAAIAARDEMIALARELAGASASARIQQTPGGGLMFVEPKE